MKIILEFKNKLEHDTYCIKQTLLLERETIEGVSNIKNGLPIDDFSRRKRWSQMELEFVKENYLTKNARWIAKQLRKKPTAVYSVLTKLYADGLPHKRPHTGEIREEVA